MASYSFYTTPGRGLQDMVRRTLFVFAAILMYTRLPVCLIAIVFATDTQAQTADELIDAGDVSRIEKTLSADDMRGRKTFSPDIEKAADFIATEFGKTGLEYWDTLTSFRQTFFSDGRKLENVIGVLPGKTLKNEYVIFSSHYDHLGVGTPDARGDSIYNGANDDASGTTAVIMLAKYFKAMNNNERTLLFVTFTGEEIGGYGSKYFSENIDPDKVVAMFNIEMIGTDSKWGQNSGYITGYEKSDFGKILQKNLEGSNFHFEPDPYPEEHLFYRSDNAMLARLGVPAHTLSTSQMDAEPHYHKQSDEFETLDIHNMTAFIKAIALSSKSIIDGTDTPARIQPRISISSLTAIKCYFTSTSIPLSP